MAERSSTRKFSWRSFAMLRGPLVMLWRGMIRAVVAFTWIIGVIAVIMLILAFTRLPYDAHRALAMADENCERKPDMVVILGGSGMPSGPELLRLHHGALTAAAHPQARVVVVHPKDTSVMNAMVDELVLKGVAVDRIHRIMEGTSTREQAIHVRGTFTDHTQRIALVTAPENIYRSVRSFQKAGYADVCGVPAFDHAMFVDLSYDHRKVGGKAVVPDVSRDLALRYDMWNYLKLQITCLREYVAIAYYKVNGWI